MRLPKQHHYRKLDTLNCVFVKILCSQIKCREGQLKSLSFREQNFSILTMCAMYPREWEELFQLLEKWVIIIIIYLLIYF